MEEDKISEFFKLDPIDKKTLFWLMDNKPEEIKDWITHVAQQRSYSEKQKLNPEKLYEEVKSELE